MVTSAQRLGAQVQSSTAGSPKFLLHLFLCLALLGLTLLLQGLAGAYTVELGGYSDEPVHFVTGLMIRDYLAAGLPSPPVAYAEQYYVHYPKVAFGMWGPLLHIAQALWMLVFPVSRTSALVLAALITAGTAGLLYRILLEETGVILAWLAAALFIAVPTVQEYTAMVMADGLVAFFDLAAAWMFARFLSTSRYKYSILFGIMASMSIMTKGNGMALVLLPPIALLLSRRFELLKRPAFWIPAIIVGGLAGPWQYYSAKMLTGILVREAGWTFLPFYTTHAFTMAGLALIPLALVGIYVKIVSRWKRRAVGDTWAAAGALMASVWLFHCLIPAASPEIRYLIAVTPPLLMFVVAGLHQVVFILTGRRPATRDLAIASAVLAAVFLATGFSIPRKLYHGFDEVADVLAGPAFRDSVVLISSRSIGEGVLVSEVAIRDKRPQHVVLRATKVLATADWSGARYQMLYHTPGELMRYLSDIPIDVVIIHDRPSGEQFPHHALLKQTIAAFPDSWEQVGVFPKGRPSESQSTIAMFRLKLPPGQSRKQPIRITLPFTLGRQIELMHPF